MSLLESFCTLCLTSSDVHILNNIVCLFSTKALPVTYRQILNLPIAHLNICMVQWPIVDLNSQEHVLITN